MSNIATLFLHGSDNNKVGTASGTQSSLKIIAYILVRYIQAAPQGKLTLALEKLDSGCTERLFVFRQSDHLG